MIAAVFLAMSAVVSVTDSNLFLSFYPCLLAGMIPGTLLAYDEQSKWDAYSGALACTRSQLVSAKYLVGLGLEAAMLLLCVAASAFRMSRNGAITGVELLLQAGIMVLISLIVPAVTLPLMFRFGVEKGRVAFFVVVAAACVGSLTLSRTAGQALEISLISSPQETSSPTVRARSLITGGNAEIG